MHTYPNITNYFPFFSCFEGTYGGNMAYAEACATKCGMDYQGLMGCVKSPLGDSLDRANAMVTTTSYHAGCPWVMINGVVCSDLGNVLSYICAAYTGVKPSGCG